MSSVTSSNLLQSLLNARKTKSPFLRKIETHLLQKESTRSTTVLHPSEIVSPNWCIRASWFLLNGHQKVEEAPDMRLRLIWEEGHVIHRKWQSWLTEMDCLIGQWYCKDHRISWWGKRSDLHRGCWAVYDEVPVEVSLENVIIQGHADGWLTGIHEQDSLLEAKSIGMGSIRTLGGQMAGTLADSFKYIDRPFSSHVRQSMLYLWCLHHMRDEGLLTIDPPKQAFILYECKEDQNIKEFMVKYDEDYLEPVFEKMELLDPDASAPDCTGIPAAGEEYCKDCKEYYS